jgi:hypothetical protein
LILTEYLRRKNFISYNSISNILYNGEDNSIIAIIDLSSGILIINVNLLIPTSLSEGSSTYYYKVTIRPILLNLVYRRLGYISEARVKALTSGLTEGLKLLSNTGYRPSKYNYYIIGKIKILPYPRKQPTLRRADRPMEILYIDFI